ncbi:hypothetical protein F5888DRAFT_1887549 [Russula emetica]|nr:hypothetical protein F5888DRAFT_1887549 [Russula emetica]
MLETIYALLAGAKNGRVAIKQPGGISPFTRKMAVHQHIILPQMLCYVSFESLENRWHFRELIARRGWNAQEPREKGVSGDAAIRNVRRLGGSDQREPLSGGQRGCTTRERKKRKRPVTAGTQRREDRKGKWDSGWVFFDPPPLRVRVSFIYRYASVVLSRLESIVAVPSSKGANGVGEEGCRTRGCEGGKVFDLFADILHRRTKVGAMSVKR